MTQSESDLSTKKVKYIPRILPFETNLHISSCTEMREPCTISVTRFLCLQPLSSHATVVLFHFKINRQGKKNKNKTNK